MSYSDFARSTEKAIREYGRAVLHVGASDFTYTIGNANKDLPELLLAGPRVNPVSVRNILNILSDKMIERGKPFDDGEMVDVGGKCPVYICEATAAKVKTEFTVQVGHILGKTDYRVLQVVLCDPAGRFPWDPGCEFPYSMVKLLRAPAN